MVNHKNILLFGIVFLVIGSFELIKPISYLLVLFGILVSSYHLYLMNGVVDGVKNDMRNDEMNVEYLYILLFGPLLALRGATTFENLKNISFIVGVACIVYFMKG